MSSLPKRATVAEAATLLERSQAAIRRYIKARNLMSDKNKRYLMAPICEQLAECERRDLRTTDGGELQPPTTWGDQLKAKQVEKLEVQIQELRGELVPMDEVMSTLAEHTAAVKGALENWKQYVAAERRDAELFEWADDAVDRALRGIQEELS